MACEWRRSLPCDAILRTSHLTCLVDVRSSPCRVRSLIWRSYAWLHSRIYSNARRALCDRLGSFLKRINELIFGPDCRLLTEDGRGQVILLFACMVTFRTAAYFDESPYSKEHVRDENKRRVSQPRSLEVLAYERVTLKAPVELGVLLHFVDRSTRIASVDRFSEAIR